MKRQIIQATLLTVLFLLGCPLAAWAADDVDTGTADLGTVTVTANKMDENLKDIAQSVSVIQGVELQEKGIKTVKDLVNEIPNFTYVQAHGNQINFRGLNTSMFTRNNPVVLYIDGIPQSNAYGYDASLANVERVEILKGPQGTMYGHDAIGGVINIITRAPDNNWHGDVAAEYGSNNFMYGAFSLNGPLVKDQWFLGINGQLKDDDGWITNTNPALDEDANQERDRKINAYLKYDTGDRFTAKLSLSRDFFDETWMDGYTLPSAGLELDHFHRDDAESLWLDQPSIEETTSNFQGLVMTYDFDAASLVSVTTHKDLHMKHDGYSVLADSSVMKTYDNHDNETWNQEVRLFGTTSRGIKWVGGLYFDRNTIEHTDYGMSKKATGLDYKTDVDSKTQATTLAAFGQVVIPFAQKFELTLGARLQRIEKEIDALGTIYYNGYTSTYPLKDETDWDAFLPKAAISYKINDKWTSYASVAKGYMPGGYNAMYLGGSVADNRFEPQTSLNYEIGVRGSYDRLHLGASVFYMDIKDIHVFKSDMGVYLTDNAQKARSLGAELECRYALTKTITLSGSAGIIDAQYEDYDNGLAQYDDENIARTPSHTLNLGVSYDHPKGFYSRLDLRNQGPMNFFDDNNSRMLETDGYTVVDAKIGYLFSNWDIYLYAKNITDEEYIDTFKSSAGLAWASFNDPRTFGAGIRYSF